MLGGVPPTKSRTAHVFVSKPVSIASYYKGDKKERKGLAENLLKDLRTNMQAMLNESMKLSNPLVKPGDIGD